MTTNPEEHDFIQQVCAESVEEINKAFEDAVVHGVGVFTVGGKMNIGYVPPRLSGDPLVRLEECRGERIQDDWPQAWIPTGKSPYVVAQHQSASAGCRKELDEAAERAKFEEWHKQEHGYVGCTSQCENRRDAWLACARSRHNESTGSVGQ